MGIIIYWLKSIDEIYVSFYNRVYRYNYTLFLL